MRALPRSRWRPAAGALVVTAALGIALALTALVGATRAVALAAQADPTTVAPPATSAVSGTITGSKTTVTPPPATTAEPPATAAAAPATTARAQPASSTATSPTTARRTAAVATVAPSTAPSEPSTVVTAVAAPTTAATASVASTTASTIVATTPAAKVGDPGATRTVQGIAWTLLATAALLAGLTAWFWRLTRPLPPVLGGLAVMGTTRWRQAPRHVQDELVSAVRVDPPALDAGAPTDASSSSPSPVEIAVEADPDLAPVVPVPTPDGSFEWPPASSPEEIAALASQYGWGRPGRPATVSAAAPFLPASTNLPAAAPFLPASTNLPASADPPVESPAGTIGSMSAASPAVHGAVGLPTEAAIPTVESGFGDDPVPNLFADDGPSIPQLGGDPSPAARSSAGSLPPPLPAPRSASEPAP